MFSFRCKLLTTLIALTTFRTLLIWWEFRPCCWGAKIYKNFTSRASWGSCCSFCLTLHLIRVIIYMLSFSSVCFLLYFNRVYLLCTEGWTGALLGFLNTSASQLGWETVCQPKISIRQSSCDDDLNNIWLEMVLCGLFSLTDWVEESWHITESNRWAIV